MPEWSTRALGWVSGTVIPIAFVCVGAYLFYHADRMGSLVERNERELATLRDAIRQKRDALATVLATELRSENGTRPGEAGSQFSATVFPSLATVPDDDVALPAASADGTRLAVVAGQDGAAVYVSYEARCDREVGWFDDADGRCGRPATKCTTNRTNGSAFARCSRIPLDALVGPLLRDGAVFDAIAVTVGTLPVKIESPGLPTGIDDDLRRALEQLPPPSTAEPKGSSESDVAKAIAAVTPVATSQIRLRDAPFYHFVERIGPGAVRATEACGDGKRADAAVRVHGLTRAATLAAEAREIPNGWLLGVLLALVLVAASWPILKLWSMGPHERLNGLDVRLLVVSMVFGTGLITFVLCQLVGHHAVIRRFDAQLGEVAARVEGRLIGDLVEANALLDGGLEPGRPVTYTDFTSILRAGIPDGRPTDRWIADGSGGVGDGSSSRVSHLTQLRAPRFMVKDRAYFRDLAKADGSGDGLWRLPTGSPKRFSAELVVSRTDGLTTLAIARRVGQEAMLIVGMRVSALVEPVLPYGFGFAFVDAHGDVKLHSDPRRNLVENIVTECGDDSRLVAALAHAPLAGTTPPLDVTYRGTPHRLVVHGVAGTPWRLVVFRNDEVLDRVNDEVIAAWAVLYLTYVGALVGLLFVVQILHDRYRAEWLWPDRRHRALHPAAAMRLLATAGVAAGALAGQPGAWRFAMLAAVAAGTVAALCRALGEPRRAVLSPVERRLARGVAASAAGVALVLAARVGDWSTASAVVVLAAAWEPTPALRGSQVVAVVVAMAVAALGWIAPSGWWVALVVATAPAWLLPPWTGTAKGGARRGALDRLATSWFPARAAAESKEWSFRVAYVSMLVAVITCVAVVPAISFYTDARRQVLWELGEFFHEDLAARASTEVAGRPGVHPAAYATSLTDRWADFDDTVPGPLDALAGMLFPRMPSFGAPIPELRALGTRGTRDAVAMPASHDVDERVPAPPSLRSQAPSRIHVPHRSPPAATIAFFALLWAALPAVGFGIVWSIVRLLFLLDVDRTEVARRPHPARGSAIVWTLAAGGDVALTHAASAEQDLVDLREPTTPEALAKRADAVVAPRLEVDHLECALVDQDLHRAVVDVLERIVRSHKKVVVLTSEIDPLRYVAARVVEAANDRAVAADADKAKEAEARERDAAALLQRWALLLDAFHRMRWEVPPGSHAATPERTVAEGLARKYPALPDEDRLPPEQADEACEARHWQIWHQCTRAEKLALRHLAEEGFLNPNAQDVARPLMQRLLVRRDPAFVLPSEAFRRFVLRAETHATVSGWEQAGIPSAWSKLRTPLMVLATLGVVYLIVAEPDALNSSIALAGGVAAALPLLLRMFAMVGDQRAGAGAR